jgi:hypothetical protein
MKNSVFDFPVVVTRVEIVVRGVIDNNCDVSSKGSAVV